MIDINSNSPIRDSLHAVRQAVAGVPLIDRALHAAEPLAKGLDPIVDAVDGRVHGVISSMQTASEPRPLPDAALPEVSKRKLMDDAQNGRFVKSRLDDMNQVGKVATNLFEKHAGAFPRLFLHSASAANSWWMNPVSQLMAAISSPIVSFVDGSIANMLSKLS